MRFAALAVLLVAGQVIAVTNIDTDLTVTSGTKSYTGDVIIGYSGTGSITQSGGAVTTTRTIILGYQQGSFGTYTLSAGNVTAVGEVVGSGGVGNFIQSGGNNTCAILGIGASDTANDPLATGGSGVYRLSGGVLNASSILSVGASTDCMGTFYQSGGELNAGSLEIGNQFFLSGGVATISGYMQFVRGGTLLMSDDGILRVSKTLYSEKTLAGLFGVSIFSDDTLATRTDGDWTVAYVIPEPATLLLMAVGAMAVRKK